MRRLTIFLSALVVSMGLAFPVWAQQGNDAKPVKKIELTEQQRKELAEIHQDILEDKLELIDKHVEYGLITKEKGDKIKERLQKRYDMLKENGYVPNPKSFDKCKFE